MRRLVLLLVLLCGAGGWNYHRNLQAENREPRPYRGLDQESLESLAEALQAEVEGLTARYGNAGQHAVEVQSEALLDERVREFERVQSISRGKRAIGQQLSKSEGSLQRVRAELRQRKGDSDPLARHLRRLLTI